jgi:hypothetical protein
MNNEFVNNEAIHESYLEGPLSLRSGVTSGYVSSKRPSTYERRLFNYALSNRTIYRQMRGWRMNDEL